MKESVNIIQKKQGTSQLTVDFQKQNQNKIAMDEVNQMPLSRTL